MANHKSAVTAAILVVAVLGVYWPATRHEFTFDDAKFVTENPAVQAGLTRDSIGWAFTSTHEGNWMPLTWLSHMLDVKLFGLKPAGHHLVNMLFHAVNSVLLLLVLARISGALWRSAFVAALFALHPLHVESVAWVAERKDVLSAFFWMLTLLAYRRYLDRPAWGRYVTLVFVFAAGLMAKPMLVTLPFVLLLFDYWPLHRLRPATAICGGPGTSPPALFARLVLEKAPLLVLSAASCVVTYYAQRRQGAVHTLDQTVLQSNIVNAVVSYGSYLLKTIWPARLAVYYPFAASFPLWRVALACLFLSGASLLAVLARRRAPWLMVGWFWYLGTLVPVIGLVRVGEQALADRYTYLTLIGVFIAAAWGIAAMPGRRVPGRARAATALAVILVLGYLSGRQLAFWENDTVLFRHALAVTKDNWVLQNNLGAILISAGKLDEAYGLLAEAIRLKPNYATAYNNLGILFSTRGSNRQALAYFTKSIELAPGDAETYFNLGMAALSLGERDIARKTYRFLQRLDPARAQNLLKFIAVAERM